MGLHRPSGTHTPLERARAFPGAVAAARDRAPKGAPRGVGGKALARQGCLKAVPPSHASFSSHSRRAVPALADATYSS